mmetsp:Transcript_13141/g.26989  ORF Transcript_13141/g.26989 Transcript_13141/m.26989 type:complete len:264 (+) Transcript_13141:1252-2043(+)
MIWEQPLALVSSLRKQLSEPKLTKGAKSNTPSLPFLPPLFFPNLLMFSSHRLSQTLLARSRNRPMPSPRSAVLASSWGMSLERALKSFSLTARSIFTKMVSSSPPRTRHSFSAVATSSVCVSAPLQPSLNCTPLSATLPPAFTLPTYTSYLLVLEALYATKLVVLSLICCLMLAMRLACGLKAVRLPPPEEEEENLPSPPVPLATPYLLFFLTNFPGAAGLGAGAGVGRAAGFLLSLLASLLVGAGVGFFTGLGSSSSKSSSS